MKIVTLPDGSLYNLDHLITATVSGSNVNLIDANATTTTIACASGDDAAQVLTQILLAGRLPEASTPTISLLPNPTVITAITSTDYGHANSGTVTITGTNMVTQDAIDHEFGVKINNAQAGIQSATPNLIVVTCPITTAGVALVEIFTDIETGLLSISDNSLLTLT